MIDPRTASLSPAALAMYATRHLSASHEYKWAPARHLNYLSEKLTAVANGDIRRLAISMPPRSGKSRLLTSFVAWYLGHHPARRMIWAASEHTLASKMGQEARDMLTDVGPDVFGINVAPDSSAKDEWSLDGHNGGMLARGIRGRLTGSGASIAIIDDPIKDPIEADSITIQEQNMDWYFAVLLGRLEPDASIILCMARWGQNDLWAGVVDDSWTQVVLPALADDDDPIGRKPGAVLWPERWSQESVEAKKKEILLKRGRRWWQAQYECDPKGREDSMWQSEYEQYVDAVPLDSLRCRAWDLAGTTGKGDFTVGSRLSLTDMGNDDVFVVLEDIVRGRWDGRRVEDTIVQTARQDGHSVRIVLEIEPGSAGKSYFAHLKSLLPDYDVVGYRPTGSKMLRAEPLIAAYQRGGVAMVRSEWNRAFIQEMRSLPGGKHDDQLDSASMGFNQLVEMRSNQPMMTIL